MLASTDGSPAVSADGWIRGIALSILASIIGGASKLAIRKSWLIDARRKHQQQQHQQSLGKNTTPYEETIGDRSFENEEPSSSLAPLEVGSPSSVSRHPQESFSAHDSDDDNIPIAGSYFFGRSKRGRNVLDPRNDKSILSPKQISWLLYLSGMVGMSFLNPSCNVMSMKYANPSILAPFSGMTLIWVVMFSGMVVGEHPGHTQKIACALIVAGEVLVGVFGDHTNGEDTRVEDVIASYQEPSFQIFIVLLTLYLLQLVIFIRVFPKDSLLRKFAWGSIGGSITGFQNFLKDALTIFDVTKKQSTYSLASNDNDRLPSAFFIFALLAMVTAFIGLLFLSACMKRYDTTYSAAMYVVSFVVSASLMSATHYQTFDHLNGFINYTMYPFGLLTLFMGAFVLVKPNAFRCYLPDDAESVGELSNSDDASSSWPGEYRERLLNGE